MSKLPEQQLHCPNIHFDRYGDPRRGGKNWKDDFQEAYSKVEKSIKPLLRNWLQDPKSGK